MWMTLTLILVLAVAVVIAIFSGQNPMELTVSFLHWQVHTSLVAVIIFAVAAGGILVGVPAMLRMALVRYHQRELSAKLLRVEQEKTQLKLQLMTLRSEMSTQASAERTAYSPTRTAKPVPPPDGDNP